TPPRPRSDSCCSPVKPSRAEPTPPATCRSPLNWKTRPSTSHTTGNRAPSPPPSAATPDASASPTAPPTPAAPSTTPHCTNCPETPPTTATPGEPPTITGTIQDIKGAWKDSNLRPHPYQGCALTS